MISYRMNVRNYLCGLTLPEMRKELAVSIEMGNAGRAQYIEEYIADVEADFDGCDENTLGY